MTSPTHHLSIVSTISVAVSWIFTLSPALLAEGPHRSVVAHSLYQSLSFLGVPDHKVCTVLLFIL